MPGYGCHLAEPGIVSIKVERTFLSSSPLEYDQESATPPPTNITSPSTAVKKKIARTFMEKLTNSLIARFIDLDLGLC